MLTLVFDTCFNKTYIVLKNNGEIVELKAIESNDSNYHSVYLIPELRNILQKNNILISDLDAIGVNIGPGSFTGIRAGITIARVLAQQTQKKLVGVSSLHILSKINKSDKNTVVISDARKNKVYYAKYAGNTVITDPMLVEKDELINKLSNENSIIIADNVYSALLNENEIENINFENNDKDLGLYLSEIVEYKLKTEQNDFHWAKVKPLYIQPPSITKPKEVKNV